MQKLKIRQLGSLHEGAGFLFLTKSLRELSRRDKTRRLFITSPRTNKKTAYILYALAGRALLFASAQKVTKNALSLFWVQHIMANALTMIFDGAKIIPD